MPQDLDVVASQAQLRLFAQAITDQAIYLLDQAGNVMSWNIGAERLQGYTSSEIIGEHFGLFFLSIDQKAWLPKRILDTSAAYGRGTNTGWLVRKNGSRFWSSLVADAVHDEYGNFVAFALLIRDLSERKITEEALRQSRQHLCLLIENLFDCAFYVVGIDGRIADWNEKAAELTGYAADEIISQSFSKFFSAEDHAKGIPERFFVKACAQGRFQTQIWCARKDGTAFFADVTINPMTDEEGEIIKYAVMKRNLSEKIASEKTKERLDESQKMAMIGELTTIIAHDFNNLLAAISGSLELICHKESQPLVDIARRAANRGAKLIDQLRAFARASTFRPQTANLNNLIKDFELFLERAAKGSIVLNLNLYPELWSCEVDQFQFQAAILNLVWSFCDRMPKGGTITIDTKNISIDAAVAARMQDITPGHYAAIIVSEAFPHSAGEWRLASVEPICSRRKLAFDAGPRLSQVRDFAQLSKGYFEWISEPGQDLTACLLLPKSLVPSTIEAAVASEAASSAHRTILVVDDDPDVLEVTIMKLERLGYTVNSAQDGQSALAIVRSTQSIDILLTDLRMPQGINGVDLAREALALRPSIHIIIASGAPRPSLEELGALQENISFLTKPYSLSLLSEKLALQKM